MPVHLYGQMCDMKAIKAIADKYDLKVIEDAAHCVEGERDGIKVGELSSMACYSFYATKNLTSGEGGAITCHDQDIYEWFLQARLHGMSKNAADRYSKAYEHYDMEILGYKCNMSNIEAALLVNQIDRVENLLKQRKALADRYTDALGQNSYIQLPQVLEDTKHCYHLYTMWVNPDKRDEYLHALQQKGVGVAVNYRPIHLMKYYREKYGYKAENFPICERIGASTLSIPLYPDLTAEEQAYVIQTINETITG